MTEVSEGWHPFTDGSIRARLRALTRLCRLLTFRLLHLSDNRHNGVLQQQKLEIFRKLGEGAYYLKNFLCCDTSFGQQLESWAARMAPWAILNRRVTDENAYPHRSAVDRPFAGRGERRLRPTWP